MRVFLGPSHIASNLWGYKKGLGELGVDAKVIVFSENRLGYPADMAFKFGGNQYLRTIKRIPYIPRLIPQFDIFHFLYGNSLLPRFYNYDVPFLKLLNKKIVMGFCGSDIRCSEEALKGGPKKIADCHECDIGYENHKPHRECDVQKKIRLVRFWSTYADAIFARVDYSQILDLMSVEYHTLILPCDLTYWAPFRSDLYEKKADETLIVHAATDQRIKGTKYVRSTTQKLRKKGFNIKFKLLTKVPNDTVREWLNVADIVIDQLLGGWHGMFAVESMAMAKPTVGYIKERYRRRQRYAEDLPIVSATPSTLEEVITRLVQNPETRKAIGQKSRKYVEKVHDCRRVAKQLLDVYSNL